MLPSNGGRRWDDDERGEGVADGPTDGDDAVLAFDVVTAMVDDTPFKPHGHTLRVIVATSI